MDAGQAPVISLGADSRARLERFQVAGAGKGRKEAEGRSGGLSPVPKELRLGGARGRLNGPVRTLEAGPGPRENMREGQGQEGQRLKGRWRVPSSASGRYSPAPAPPPPSQTRGICCPRASASQGLRDPGSLPCPGCSQAERGHSHSESPATTFPAGLRALPSPGPLRPPQTLSRRSSAGPGKTPSGAPARDARRSAGSWDAVGVGPGPRLRPQPWGN